MSSEFGCIADVEYGPRLDVAWFDQTGQDWSEWAMEAAIEHENNVFWEEELCKLLLINAGLKVLVAYEDDLSRIREMLEQFVTIHRSRKYSGTGGWLFIFGPRIAPSLSDFAAFKFDGACMVEITDGEKILSAVEM